jgi:glycogen(starch) synthase
VVLDTSAAERRDLEVRARTRAMSFDRAAVFDGLFPQKTPAAVL